MTRPSTTTATGACSSTARSSPAGRRRACTLQGDYYDVQSLRLAPAVPEELVPGLMVSGSSEAGMAVASELGAIAVKYPQPPDRESSYHAEPAETGIRLGIITRENAEEAWTLAHARFPPYAGGHAGASGGNHGLGLQLASPALGPGARAGGRR